MLNHDCVSFSSSIVNVPYVIILSVDRAVSSQDVNILVLCFLVIYSGYKTLSVDCYISLDRRSHIAVNGIVDLWIVIVSK